MFSRYILIFLKTQFVLKSVIFFWQQPPTPPPPPPLLFVDMYGSASVCSAGFTYRLDRLKHMASKFRGPPAKVYIIFNTIIGLSHLCCHIILYFLFKQPFSNFSYTVGLHFRILQNFKYPSSSSPLLKLIKHTSCSPSREDGELRGVSHSQVE